VPTDDPVITVDTPLAEPHSPYGASKAAIERELRALAGAGVPVTTFVPGGVFGPRALDLDQSFSAVLGALELVMLTPPGGCNVIDVRDLAALMAAALEPGRGPRRYLVGGHYLTWPAWVAALSTGAGRPVAAQEISEADLLAMGRQCDELRRAGKDGLPLSEEAAVVMCAARPTDDTAALGDLGVAYRPVEETFADVVAYLRERGALGG
jgi:nucleoside-diphosphate-sugar epimerase